MLVVYGKTICPNCTKVKGLLDKDGIKYEYINLEDDINSYIKIRDLGFKQVPLLELNGDVLGGMESLQTVLEWHTSQ